MQVLARQNANVAWLGLPHEGLASGSGRLRRRFTYPALGALLALGAPLGLLLLRATLYAWPPTVGWVLYDLGHQSVTYAYLTLSTTAVFTILGWRVGRAADRLGALSTTDALTGLPNVRHFRAHLREELARARRQRTPLSLLLVDVDGLKNINDAGGHEAGDRALEAVARGLVEACRATDFPARVGGDEFAVLAPVTRARDALELADRIRAAVRGASGPVPVQVSIGVGDLDLARALRADALVRVADRALYRAKHGGRDRSSLPPEPDDPGGS